MFQIYSIFQNFSKSFYPANLTFSGVFNSVSPKDAFDILIVAIFIYLVIIFIKQTRSFFIFSGVFALLVVYFLSINFDLGLTRQLFQPLLTFFVIIFVVVFQKEIRSFFKWTALSKNMLSHLGEKVSIDTTGTLVMSILELAKRKMGAIIVLRGEQSIDDLLEGGHILDGKISMPLILSIFDHHTPGHDGAVVIENHFITQYGAHLPLAEEFMGIQGGTRHRAGLGISERSDVMAIIVSEERGTISIAENGVMRIINGEDELSEVIKGFLKENVEVQSTFWRYFIEKNFWAKVSSIALAIFLWFTFVFQSGFVTQDFNVPIEFKFLPAEYVITDNKVKEAGVSLEGGLRDITNVDIKDVKVLVDLKDAIEGENTIKLGKDNVTFPPFLRFADIKPKSIKITISKVPTE